MKLIKREHLTDPSLELHIAEFKPQRRLIKFSYFNHINATWKKAVLNLPFPYVFLIARVIKQDQFAGMLGNPPDQLNQNYPLLAYTSFNSFDEVMNGGELNEVPLPNIESHSVCLGKAFYGISAKDAFDYFWHSNFNTDIIYNSLSFFSRNFLDNKPVPFYSYDDLIPYFKKWEQMDVANLNLRKLYIPTWVKNENSV